MSSRTFLATPHRTAAASVLGGIALAVIFLVVPLTLALVLGF